MNPEVYMFSDDTRILRRGEYDRVDIFWGENGAIFAMFWKNCPWCILTNEFNSRIHMQQSHQGFHVVEGLFDE